MRRALLVLFALMLSAIGAAELDFSTLLPARKWAICVGASDYQKITKLKYAGRDAVLFSNFLVEYGFRKDEVTTLSDEAGFEKPTAKNFNRRLEQILKDPDLEKGDQFIVYFSGHGVGLKDGDFWLPTDADPKNYAKDAISIKQVIRRLAEAGLKSVTILSDACRAGEKNPFGQELIRLGKTTNIAVMLGCAPGAKSYELPNRQQGAFTYYLTRSLKNKDLADPTTGAVWVSNIGKRVSEVVSAATQAEYGSNRQVPVVYADAAQDVAFGLVLQSQPSAQLAAVSAQRLDPLQHYSVVSKLAEELKNAGKNEEAVACYKALETLGILSDSQLLGYFVVLGRLNRAYETKRLYDKFILGKPLTNRRAAVTLLQPSGSVGRERIREAVEKLEGKIAEPFDEISFLSEVQWKREVPHAEIAAYIRRRLNQVQLSAPERTFLEARTAYFEGKKEEAYVRFRSLIDSNLDRGDLVDSMLVCFSVKNASEWLQLAKGTKGLSEVSKQVMLDLAWSLDRKNLRDYVKQVLAEGISPVELLKLSPRLLDGKAITSEELRAALAGSPLSFEHNLARWVVSCLERDKYGDKIPEAVFAYGESRTKVVREAFDLWMEFASIEKWKPDEYEAAWDKKKEILASFRPHLDEISADSSLLADYLNALTEAGFSADAYYWTEFTLKLTPAQFADPKLTGARLLASLNVGDMERVALLREQLSKNFSQVPEVAIHLIWDDILRDRWVLARALYESLREQDEIDDHLKLLDVIFEFQANGAEAAVALAERLNGSKFSEADNRRQLVRVVEYLVKRESVGLGLIATLSMMQRDWDHVAVLSLIKFQPEIAANKDPGIAAFGQALRPKLCGYPSSFALDPIFLAGESSLGDFEGSYGFALEMDYNWQPGIKRIDFTVDANGNVSGTIDKWGLKGTVDKFGNLDLRMIVNDRPAGAVRAKIPSLKLIKSSPTVSWEHCARFAVLENRPLLAHFLAKFNLKK